jgi:hypothetical protein
VIRILEQQGFVFGRWRHCGSSGMRGVGPPRHLGTVVSVSDCTWLSAGERLTALGRRVRLERVARVCLQLHLDHGVAGGRRRDYRRPRRTVPARCGLFVDSPGLAGCLGGLRMGSDLHFASALGGIRTPNLLIRRSKPP